MGNKALAALEQDDEDLPSWMRDIAQAAEEEENQLEEQEKVPVTSEVLMALANELIGIEAEKTRITAELKQIEDRRKQLRTQLIPDAMNELGMTKQGRGSFTVAGFRVHLEQKLHAGCSKENRPLLFDYLRQVGDAELIQEVVNAQTLSAYVRECRSEGLNDPPGVSVHEEVTAKLTKVK